MVEVRGGSPLNEDGSINTGWEEVKQPVELTSLHPFSTPGLRIAFGVPRVDEVAMGVHPTRMFTRIERVEEVT